MPKVSVIISSYNHANYIGLAIESVLCQTVQDFEIIIADDASTDHTQEIVAQYLNDPRVRFFQFERNREEHMKNYCLQFATGEYIAVLNSDDVFHPQKLYQQVAYLDSNSTVGACFTSVEWIDEKGGNVSEKDYIFSNENKSRFEWLRHFFIHGNCLCHSSVIFRKSLLDKIGFYNRWLALLSDLDFWIRICLETDIYILSEKLTFNRLIRGEGNASGARPEVFNRNNFEQYQIMEHYFSDRMLAILPEVFPDQKDFYVNDYEKRKILFALYASQSPLFAVKFYGLNVLYSFLKTTSREQHLGNLKNEELIQDYYKLVSKSNLLPITTPVVKLKWCTDNVNEAKEFEVLAIYDTVQTMTFGLPSLKENVSFTLSIDKAPFTIFLEALELLNERGEAIQDLRSTVTVHGALLKQTSLEKSIKVSVLESVFSLSSTGKLNPNAVSLKICFKIIPGLAVIDIEKEIEKRIELEVKRVAPLIIAHQNVEDISAIKLLSALAKKIVKRIKLRT